MAAKHLVFPFPSRALAPLECDPKYTESIRESTREHFGKDAPLWGKFEGKPEMPRGSDVVMWQTRTKFSELRQDWTAVPQDIAKKLEDVWKHDKSGTVEFVIQGHTFTITLSNMEQTNKQFPDRIRDVRRVTQELRDWWLVEVVRGRDGAPELLSTEASNIIDQGTGRREGAHGAVLYGLSIAGQPFYVDMEEQMVYDSLEEGATGRRMVAIPRSISQQIYNDDNGVLPPSCPLYSRLVQLFEDTKWGQTTIEYDDGYVLKDPEFYSDVTVESIQWHIRRTVLVQFLEKMRRMGDDCRLMAVFHGTSEENTRDIVNDNFSFNKIGSNTKNQGWFGKGFYFARRAYNALGYGGKKEHLLVCLVIVSNVFRVPFPDNHKNYWHGRDLNSGYDAHLSPSGRELVVNNQRQVLPCFVLRFNESVESRGSAQYMD